VSKFFRQLKLRIMLTMSY